MKSVIKLLLSAALLAIVFVTIDIQALGRTIANMKPLAVAVVVGIYALGQLLSSIKWWLIARNGGLDIPYTSALKAYFIGTFANCFGLGMMGGDVTRGLLIAQGQPLKTEGLASVIADRVHGLIVLALIGGFAALFVGDELVPPNFLTPVGIGCVLLIAGWFLGPAICSMVGAKSEIKLLRKLDHVAQVFPRSPRTLVAITAISIVFHLVQIMLHSVMAWGLGAYIPFQHLLVVIPLVNIAGSLPISWNGLGVRENAYVFFLTPALISKEQAVAFGAIWLLAMTVCSAIGGVIAFTSGDLKFLRQKKKELGNTDALEAAITTEQKAA